MAIDKCRLVPVVKQELSNNSLCRDKINSFAYLNTLDQHGHMTRVPLDSAERDPLALQPEIYFASSFSALISFHELVIILQSDNKIAIAKIFDLPL